MARHYRPRRGAATIATFIRMRHVAKALGQLFLAIGAIFGIAVVRLLVLGDHAALLDSAVLAVTSALPGWLFLSFAITAERREKAAAVIRTRERFTIDEIAQLLRQPAEVAHVFIAGQIAAHGLALAYQQDTRGY